MKPLVAATVILVSLAAGAPVQAQTPELDELRALAEQGDAGAQVLLGMMYDTGAGVPEDDTEAVRWYRRVVSETRGRPGTRQRGSTSGSSIGTARAPLRTSWKPTCGLTLPPHSSPVRIAT